MALHSTQTGIEPKPVNEVGEWKSGGSSSSQRPSRVVGAPYRRRRLKLHLELLKLRRWRGLLPWARCSCPVRDRRSDRCDHRIGYPLGQGLPHVLRTTRRRRETGAALGKALDPRSLSDPADEHACPAATFTCDIAFSQAQLGQFPRAHLEACRQNDAIYPRDTITPNSVDWLLMRRHPVTA